MIPILILLMSATILACFVICFKSNKVKLAIAAFLVFAIVATFAVCFVGYKNVTRDSYVVANVKLGDEHRDLFYDEVEDEYFYTKSDIWRAIYPQYRVYVDYDTAKVYVEKYNELKEFDFESAMKGEPLL